MTPDWIEFLQLNGALINTEQTIDFIDNNTDNKRIYPITNLTALSVSGADAESFLQGQLTCNIKEVNDNQASFAAFCTAKGRVISTLLVFKQNVDYLIILPAALADKVINKLRMYILRSKVKIENLSEQFCLLGLQTGATYHKDTKLPAQVLGVNQGTETIVKFPGAESRYLVIASIEQSKQFWTEAVSADGVSPANSSDWIFNDLSAGIPWFSEDQSEEYIPQMLNIDKLGGISFNKGCYTGQEIVARTHYLGKAKRELFLAECALNSVIDSKSAIIDRAGQEACGKILAYCCNKQVCRLLLVMPTEHGENQNLIINNSEQDTITLIPFQ